MVLNIKFSKVTKKCGREKENQKKSIKIFPGLDFFISSVWGTDQGRPTEMGSQILTPRG